MIAPLHRRPALALASLVVTLVATVTACASRPTRPLPPSAEERELALLFTGDSWGELEPCG